MDGPDTYSDVSGVHGAIREEAHAKVNLTLEVIGKRGDGYHNIVSIIQTIDIHDVLTIESAPELSVTCDDPELPGESNLALLAAEALCRYSRRTPRRTHPRIEEHPRGGGTRRRFGRRGRGVAGIEPALGNRSV